MLCGSRHVVVHSRFIEERHTRRVLHRGEARTAHAFAKVPEVTVTFWILKILATTLGETAGDSLSMTLQLGYALSSLILIAVFVIVVTIQIRARSFHPFLYWAVIIATTTVGTTMADFADRSLGIGYLGGSLILAGLLAASLATWYFSAGTIAVDSVTSPKIEAFYWVAILFSQTLGTALGDWVADDTGLGYAGGALVFSAGLALVIGCYSFTTISRAALFWSAFVLTRPLGATLGDLLDKPHADGGFALSRIAASVAITVAVVVGVLIFPQKAERANQLASDR
jgi:uncharacterized membrane-anchored protein